MRGTHKDKFVAKHIDVLFAYMLKACFKFFLYTVIGQNFYILTQTTNYVNQMQCV